MKIRLHVDHADSIKGTLLSVEKKLPRREETLFSFALKCSAGAIFGNKAIARDAIAGDVKLTLLMGSNVSCVFFLCKSSIVNAIIVSVRVRAFVCVLEPFFPLTPPSHTHTHTHIYIYIW